MKILITFLFLLFFSVNTYADNLTKAEKIEIEKLYKKQNISTAEADRIFELENKGENVRGGKYYKRIQYYRQNRTLDANSTFNSRTLWNNTKALNKSQSTYLNQNNAWEMLGPFNFPIGKTGNGRVNIIRIHPDNSRILYLASAGGGLWKSTNHGNFWTILPNTDLLSMTYSDLIISRSNPNIIYAATGDSDATFYSPDNFYSIGVIKSTDAGNTWNVTNLSYDLDELNTVSRILVDYNNSNIVFAATRRGIYKTIDGGESWELKTSPFRFKEMEYHPFNPEIIVAATYAQGGGASIYASNDGGETWELTSTSEAVRVDMAYCKKNPNYLYALETRTGGAFLSLSLSNDFGNTWEKLQDYTTGSPNVLGWSSTGADDRGQGGFDLALAVNPADPEDVYTGGINIWNFDKTGNWTYKSVHALHADQHFIDFNKTGDTMYIANDGGAFRYLTKSDRYEQMSNGLNLTQYYRISATADDDFLLAGAQDNGTASFAKGTWLSAGGADGMDNAINQIDKNYMYYSIQNGRMSLSVDAGKQFGFMVSPSILGNQLGIDNYSGAWVSPIVLDPNNPKTVYVGYEHLWRHNNYGIGVDDWEQVSTFTTGTLIAIAVAPSDSDVIYIASPGVLHKTTDRGENWELLSSTLAPITYLAVDPKNANRVFITSGSFDKTKKVHIYDEDVLINITGNLPNVPVNAIVYQEETNDRLYVGTDLGVYFTENNSAYWQRYGTDLPHVNVMDLEINKKSNSLYAGTYGRGLWKIDLMTCAPKYLAIKAIGETEFCVGDSVIIESVANLGAYRWSNGETTKRIVVKEAGKYSLMSGDDECSFKSEYIEVNTIETPQLTVNFKKTNICPGNSTNISVANGYFDYLWNDGSTESRRTIDKEGLYYYSAVSEEGCKLFSDTLNLKFYEVIKPYIKFTDSVLIAPPALSYKWFLNEEEIEGATEQEYRYEVHGVYTVEIKTATRCLVTSFGLDTENPGNSVDEYSSKVVISPNPSFGIFRIQNNNDFKINSVRIFDLNSKLISEINKPLNDFIINLEAYPNSTYFVEIQMGNFVLYKFLIKE